MEDLIFDVKALASVKGMTIEELANACGIQVEHLRNVSCGRTKMSGDDLTKLSTFTGVPVTMIKLN